MGGLPWGGDDVRGFTPWNEGSQPSAPHLDFDYMLASPVSEPAASKGCPPSCSNTDVGDREAEDRRMDSLPGGEE